MTNLLIQTISEDTVGLVVYVEDVKEYQDIKDALSNFKNRINKPILICVNQFEILNAEDLKRFGLQQVEI